MAKGQPARRPRPARAFAAAAPPHILGLRANPNLTRLTALAFQPSLPVVSPVQDSQRQPARRPRPARAFAAAVLPQKRRGISLRG